ncbi:MAG: K(+)-transporting ATPase subunit C [Chitinophagaceae bacterium]|nr:K(+)-transporting ATPase subunit C [Chitinophagaceae bacterium]
MKEHIFPAIKLTALLLLLCAGAYPLLVWGIAQATPQKGKAEIIEANGKRFYANLAQKFTDDHYFQSRPSAVDYNAAGSAGSNKGPSNTDYLAAVQSRIDTFLVHNPGIDKKEIPVDLITASGSGLDPDISVQAAFVQVKRIAKIRGIAEQNLRELIINQTQPPLAGMLGPEKINVLQLNLALDQLK